MSGGVSQIFVEGQISILTDSKCKFGSIKDTTTTRRKIKVKKKVLFLIKCYWNL